MPRVIIIDKCEACQYCTSGRHYGHDSFEMVFEYKCLAKDKQKIAIRDHNEDIGEIPEWCPLTEVNIENTAWFVMTDEEFVKYEDRYRVFPEDKLKEALTYAIKLGYQDPLGMGINKKIGMLNMYSAEHTIGIMHIEIK